MKRADWFASQIAAQEQWIRDHGGTLSAYLARYGAPDMPHCYGDGGAAIYAADTHALETLREQYGRALRRTRMVRK